jgi:hypothetical protein
MIDELYPSQLTRQVKKLSTRAKIHQAQSARQALQAKHYKTLAASYAVVATSHQLIAQRRKNQAKVDTAMQLTYELQTQYHNLQAEQCYENFLNYRLMAMDSEKRAVAHQMLAEHLVNHVIPLN